MSATLDGEAVPYWAARRRDGGQRAAAGRDRRARASAPTSPCGAASTCPITSAAAATFTLGHFGGHGGRALRAGDVLHICAKLRRRASASAAMRCRGGAASQHTATHWEIGVLYGPHGAPDFFTRRRHRRVLRDRLGSALQLQPHRRAADRPEAAWARADGGEAGLHPSNIHDNAYAIGAVDFTGDMPVILGPDGPSLGGFVCPAIVVARRAVEARPAAARRHACASCASTPARRRATAKSAQDRGDRRR